ncbi:MAG: flavin reductase family protein [Succinivibrio sp.]
MYKTIETKLAYRAFAGGPIVNLFSKDENGVADGMTAAWNCPFDVDVLLVVIDKGHTTYENILKTGKVVISLPNADQIPQLLSLGSVHGRDVGNKLEKQNINVEKSKSYGFDVMSDALAYFECTLDDKALFEDKGILLARVENVYVKEDLWSDSEESFNPGCLNTLHHVSGGSFSTGGKVVK